MEITIETGPLNDLTADALVLGIWEGEPLAGASRDIDLTLDGAISDAIGLDSADLTGKKGEHALFYTRRRMAVNRVLVIGLGKQSEAKPWTLSEAAGTAVRLLRSRHANTIALALHKTQSGSTRNR